MSFNYRRLRDRFIEAERLSLAMEVSTKCGLDTSGVWGAAGFALLQAGDFPGAREKFSRCMKVSEWSACFENRIERLMESGM